MKSSLFSGKLDCEYKKSRNGPHSPVFSDRLMGAALLKSEKMIQQGRNLRKKELDLQFCGISHGGRKLKKILYSPTGEISELITQMGSFPVLYRQPEHSAKACLTSLSPEYVRNDWNKDV